MTRPCYTPSNPLYKEPPFDNDEAKTKFFTGLKMIGEVLKPNSLETTSFIADDLAVWFRVLGFLEDEDFKRATEPYQTSLFVRAKLWRIYTYCWAVKQSPRGATKIDLGCYDGKTVHIAQRYLPDMVWGVFDTFSNHPSQKNKEKHSTSLWEEVTDRLDECRIYDGLLPNTLDSFFNDWISREIGFIHVDLNDGETEVSCLKLLWDRVVKGGIVLLDDYGWARYRHSHELHKAFFKQHGQDVLEMPTGQGMVVKR